MNKNEVLYSDFELGSWSVSWLSTKVLEVIRGTKGNKNKFCGCTMRDPPRACLAIPQQPAQCTYVNQ
jgi:hypothetical protein